MKIEFEVEEIRWLINIIVRSTVGYIEDELDRRLKKELKKKK